MITWVAILSIISGGLEVVFEAFAGIGRLYSVSTTSAGTTVSLPPFWSWFVYLGASVVIGLVTLVLLRLSFRALVPADARFSMPATLSLVALIGIVLALAGWVLLLGTVYQAVGCAGAGQPLTRSCLPLSVFIGSAALVAVGGITTLVGIIGTLIGIWRFGTRHEEPLFKAAAILLIFPIANIVGAILMLVAARSALRKVEAMTAGATPPWGTA